MLIRTPSELGAIIKSTRKRLGMDQTELAQKIGVSRWWLVEIEKGKPRAELGLVLRTLAALDIDLAANLRTAKAKHKSTAKYKKANILKRRSEIDIDAIIARARRV